MLLKLWDGEKKNHLLGVSVLALAFLWDFETFQKYKYQHTYPLSYRTPRIPAKYRKPGGALSEKTRPAVVCFCGR